MLRLQGFPDTYKIVCNYGAMRKLTGNSVAVPVVEAVVRSVLDVLEMQYILFPFVERKHPRKHTGIGGSTTISV